VCSRAAQDESVIVVSVPADSTGLGFEIGAAFGFPPKEAMRAWNSQSPQALRIIQENYDGEENKNKPRA